MSGPRIIVTNDDGIFSEGIERLATSLASVGDVFTVAPDQERSAAGHSLTLHHPLRAKLIGPQRWSVDGTPTDCVNWGVLPLLKDERPKLLFSGINLGLNLADDVLAWTLEPDGTWRKVPTILGLESHVRFQELAVARASRSES